MEMSLKTGFAPICSRCEKNLSFPKFGGAAHPPRPYAYVYISKSFREKCLQTPLAVCAFGARYCPPPRPPINLTLVQYYFCLTGDECFITFGAIMENTDFILNRVSK